MATSIRYQSGFGNHFQTEAEPNTLPQGQNSPQKVPHGLYAEQLSGSAFTQPRQQNLRSWLYRIRPSVLHGPYRPFSGAKYCMASSDKPLSPQQLRWDPLPIPKKPTDFIEGLISFADNGHPAALTGSAIHLYAANRSMSKQYFYNADGDLLIVPQLGNLSFHTEFGALEVKPGEIIVIPRGIKFQVHLLEQQARGYICENFGAPFELPELGPIGANGLANPRDFQYPVACYEHKNESCEMVAKFQNNLWVAELNHSPLDVVAWHGNYAPYKYDLSLFNTINTVSFDHPDPSIFTVLTSATNTAGKANIDFVIFPDRWMVAEHTFRPPYFHRNIMNEYMGLICGTYDAKSEEFAPGGGSLHNCMSAHGPDSKTYDTASTTELKPVRYHGTLAFMFESCYPWRPTDYALKCKQRQADYHECWQGLKPQFEI